MNIGGRDRTDGLAEIEVMLRELDSDDLQPVAPPRDVWSNIERAIARAAPVVALESRSHRRRWLLTAAAVVVLAVAGALVTVIVRGGKEDVVSTAVLEHDPAKFDPRGADSNATALLVERGGQYELELTHADLPKLADDDLELWLIEPDASGNPVDIQPVAVLKGSRPGTYKVPHGVDPASHYVVDISIEHRDGNAAHSGKSILRGPLEPA